MSETDKVQKDDDNYETVTQDAEYLREEHSKYNFGAPESSTVIDANGDEHDISFRTEIGKVSYEKTSEEMYLVTFNKDNPEGGVIVEKRELSLDMLSSWFYDPTIEYYESVVSLINTLD